MHIISNVFLSMKYWSIFINLIARNKLFVALVLADCLLIGIHFWFGAKLSFFNLDRESNLPTVYQGLKLLTFGYYFLARANQFWRGKPFQANWLFWILPAAMFIFLGVDELAMIHENIPNFVGEINAEFNQGVIDEAAELGYRSAPWVIYYLPFIVLVAFPVFIFEGLVLLRKLHVKKIYIFMFLLGVAQLASVPVLEATNTTWLLSPEDYNYSMALEEGFEMLGVSLIGLVFWKVAQMSPLKGDDVLE